VPLLQDMEGVMQSNESPSDLTNSESVSHIFRTLDNAHMGLHFDGYGHGSTKMGKKSTTWALHPRGYLAFDGGRCTKR
jgi:hypothetical protein